ncbi:aminoglycoside phosphotransferase [Azoarcus sp. CIB]|uniref:phosphotransferase family protein n=1 Tax=Aromatoleum sp. (strain CIB) TaxID=198107 RepID=UPI00067CAF15|nr:phosphotransferase family protein [Azoarcus sp. CIB]AKU12361.1 aminoglycoside phosphotransferase [Azoarcus sp. CIB]
MAREAWQELVDVDRLAAWMDSRGLAQGAIADARPLTGGTQNLLLRFRRGDRQFVLRRPPQHPRMDGTATMQREARVLGALAGTRVPHARLIAGCDDKTILGAGFYLMEPVEGFTPTGPLPAPFVEHAGYRQQIGLAMAEAIAELAAVDYVAVGLADFGKIEGYLERQVGRWRSQLEGYRDYPGWPGPAGIPGTESVGLWLEANKPATFQPGIVHGDYHLANVMFQHERPELAAIVDWELATIGDPLIDLGWLIATWPDAGGASIVPKLEASPWDHFVHADELIERYAQTSRRDLSDLRWYTVLACYKLGILLEGSYARACAGKAPMDVGLSLHAATLRLFERAQNWMESR